MKDQILELFKREFPDVAEIEMRQIAERWKMDDQYLKALDAIAAIEKNLGPIGIWCSKYESRLWSFYYPTRYDGIFRELKYVYMRLFTSSPLRTTTTRDIVNYSVAHVENCLKLFRTRMKVRSIERAPLGGLIRMASLQLDANLAEDLTVLARIWSVAKHDYNLQTEVPFFDTVDALMVYLASRKLGFRILTNAGEMPLIVQASQDGPLLRPSLYI